MEDRLFCHQCLIFILFGVILSSWFPTVSWTSPWKVFSVTLFYWFNFAMCYLNLKVEFQHNSTWLRYHLTVNLIAEPIDDKIVGGYNVFRGQYPWVLGIWEKTHGQYFTPRHLRRPFCGGSLITDRFVLTAAHCVYQKDIAR